MTRRADGFAGLSLVPDHVETTGEVSASRQAGCREAIVLFLREMADRVEGADMAYQWVEHPMTAVLVLLGVEDASVACGGDMTAGVDDLVDASQCVLAFTVPDDLVARQEHVADTRSWRVQERRNSETARRQFEQEHPYLCGCGKRTKTQRGLEAHERSHRRG